MKLITLDLKRGMIALLPVAALLVFGLVWFPKNTLHTTPAVLLLPLGGTILLTFLGELGLLFWIQQAQQKHCNSFIEACQKYLGGQQESRPTMQGDPTLLPVARLLNSLLDMITEAQEQSVRQSTTIQNLQQEQGKLNVQMQNAQSHSMQIITQLQTVIRSVKPVLQGNLRAHAELPPGEVGMLADICNALIEEVGKLVYWTRTSSQQLTKSTQTLLRSAAELAQNVEAQLQRSTQTTEATEQVVTFLQRLSGALHLSLEQTQEMQIDLQRTMSTRVISPNTLQQVQQVVGQQSQIVIEMEQEAHKHLMLAETIMADYYDIAMRLYQSSTSVLQTAEQLTELTTMARQWEQEVATFQLPESSSQKPAKSTLPTDTPAWEPQALASIASLRNLSSSQQEGSFRAHLL